MPSGNVLVEDERNLETSPFVAPLQVSDCSGVEGGGTAPVRRRFAGSGLPARWKVALLNGAVPQRIQLMILLLLPRCNPRRASSGRLITSW